jgi:hypothetical protein
VALDHLSPSTGHLVYLGAGFYLNCPSYLTTTPEWATLLLRASAGFPWPQIKPKPLSRALSPHYYP